MQITVAQEDRRDDEKLYHKISLQELQTMSPFVSLYFAVDFDISASVLILNFVSTGTFFWQIK